MVSFLIKGTTGKYFHVEADVTNYFDQDFLDLFNPGVQIFMGEPVKKEPTYSDEWIPWNPWNVSKGQKKPDLDDEVYVDYLMYVDYYDDQYHTARASAIDWTDRLSREAQIRAYRVSKNQK